jgi:hypothetical protein
MPISSNVETLRIVIWFIMGHIVFCKASIDIMDTLKKRGEQFGSCILTCERLDNNIVNKGIVIH